MKTFIHHQNSFSELRSWVLSDEGKKTIEKILLKVEKITAELTEARRVRPESLRIPMTL